VFNYYSSRFTDRTIIPAAWAATNHTDAAARNSFSSTFSVYNISASAAPTSSTSASAAPTFSFSASATPTFSFSASAAPISYASITASTSAATTASSTLTATDENVGFCGDVDDCAVSASATPTTVSASYMSY
jgi:hypothetical protein